jgi:hypothetical protein
MNQAAETHNPDDLSAETIEKLQPYSDSRCMTCQKAVVAEHRLEVFPGDRWVAYFGRANTSLPPHGVIDLDPGRRLTRDEARERERRKIDARKAAEGKA